jgi:hypothetical protein
VAPQFRGVVRRLADEARHAEGVTGATTYLKDHAAALVSDRKPSFGIGVARLIGATIIRSVMRPSAMGLLGELVRATLARSAATPPDRGAAPGTRALGDTGS